MLTNVTSSISGETLHEKMPVVCVALINRTVGNVKYHCCHMHKEATEPATIRCDQSVHISDWNAVVLAVFHLTAIFLTFYCPALPLALPDYVFSLENEVEKENRLAEQTNRETTGDERIANSDREGGQDNQRGTGADRWNTETVVLITTTTTTAVARTTNSNNNTNREQTFLNTSNRLGNSRERGEESEFIPVDDSSPMNVSTLVRFTILGLTLNISIVTPYVVFVLALTTYLYLCYDNMQNKYKDVKKIISERREELHMTHNAPQGTISAKLYWFVCKRVLPHEYEFLRMLRNMVFVVLYLIFALSSIVFFRNKFDLSTLTLTMSLLFTGSIPSLLLKTLTTETNVIGWAKIRMVREIDQVIKEY
ncbi:PREDICTED: uncharacterized protein LOC107358445 [Acropora digitifera]|uniref:uncharacterized protein LOC107358445 n=1 Tax=Acropora digitifera TaxID=70779 RepID=UPI00077A484B|nr:PREDICTED: uncharacterized protein LOC107358445 [Acropora digitifera]